MGVQYRTGFAAAFVDNDASAADVLLLLTSASTPSCDFAPAVNAADVFVAVAVVVVVCPKPYTFGCVALLVCKAVPKPNMDVVAGVDAITGALG